MQSAADVIIIGSGPAGASAAWPLVEAGVRVLMIDAGDATALPIPPAPESTAQWRSDPDRWRHELGTDGAIEPTTKSPKFTTPLSKAALAGFGDVAGLAARNFFAVGSLAPGGLSRIWGALATEYLPDELSAWGTEADALRSGYARVRARIGISPPPVLTPAVEAIFRAHGEQAKAVEFALDRAENAVLAQPRPLREGCNACGQCLLGCGRGAIYHGAHELAGLRLHRNFSYRSGLIVNSLGGRPGGHEVRAVSRDGEAVTLRAPAVILAAGTLMTTKLALRRLGLFGMDVRLESNPVGGTAFLVPRLIGSDMPEKSFGLGQLFYSLDLGGDVTSSGVVYGADSLPVTMIADRLPFTRPVAMRLARALMPALVLATGYLPGWLSDNFVRLEDDGGDGRLIVEGGQSPATHALLRESFRQLARQMRKLGGWQLPTATQLLEPGSDAHPGGTLPMGGTGPAATLANGELAGVPGIHIADGAALPYLSSRHPTLTIMANADRIGHAIARTMAAPLQVRACAG